MHPSCSWQIRTNFETPILPCGHIWRRVAGISCSEPPSPLRLVVLDHELYISGIGVFIEIFSYDCAMIFFKKARAYDLSRAMSLKPLALAVTAASQRELFHVPAAPAALRPAFLAPAQPGQVSFLCAFFFRGAIRTARFKDRPQYQAAIDEIP